MANSYDVPSWAGKPPTGLHLDVLKEDKLVQKLMVDEKKCYLFGRNAQMNDFCIDHASCSRVHAALVYHKHLNIAYLVDLGSTHGTFIGNLRLEPHKPTQLQINSTFHFGASTRRYILRERPSTHRMNIMEDIPMSELNETLLGLPESQTDLDNLTEYNTAHNRRISMLGIADDNIRKQNANKTNPRKRRNVTFNDEEIIINPEDIDPSVGRFRNLVQTTVVPTKRARYDTNHIGMPTSNASSLTTSQIFHQNILSDMKQNQNLSALSSNSLYNDLPATVNKGYDSHMPNNDQSSMGAKYRTSTDFELSPIAMGTKLGLLLPNPAPDVTPIFAEPELVPSSTLAQRIAKANSVGNFDEHQTSNAESGGGGGGHEPQKKKYAKEAWPGRKQMLGQL